MKAHINGVVGLLADNLQIRGTVLPISNKVATKWSEGLNLPRGGETVIYTGLMYQIIPHINALVNMLEKFEGTFLMNFVGIGRFFNKFFPVSKFSLVSKKDIERHNATLTRIAKLLKKAGVTFGSLYEDDLYAGALAYDLGADSVVKEHAQKIFANLKKHGVKTIITVDPHTLHMLREVFPKIIPEFKFTVKSYAEVLNEKGVQPKAQVAGDVVLHDSCIYARHEGVVDEPRALLSKMGLKVAEPTECKKYTFCCGGPAESLFPSKALTVGTKRMEQLGKMGAAVAVMCPICYANLSRVKTDTVKVRDFSEYLEKGYLD